MRTADSNNPPNSPAAGTLASGYGLGPNEVLVQVKNFLRAIPNLFSNHGDGCFISADGDFLAPNTNLSEIKKIVPGSAQTTDQPILFINGMNIEPEKMIAHAQALADQSGAPIIPLYNLSKGSAADTVEALLDRIDLNHSGATTTLTDILIKATLDNNPIHVAGHSQGALIISKAFFAAARFLVAEHKLSEQEIPRAFKIHTVETFGGAASIYQDGPRYIHYVNLQDPIAWYFGLAKHGLKKEEIESTEADLLNAEHLNTIATYIGAAKANIGALVTPATWPGDSSIIIHKALTKREITLKAHTLSNYLSYRHDPAKVEASINPGEPDQRNRAMALADKTPGAVLSGIAKALRRYIKQT